MGQQISLALNNTLSALKVKGGWIVQDFCLFANLHVCTKSIPHIIGIKSHETTPGAKAAADSYFLDPPGAAFYCINRICLYWF